MTEQEREDWIMKRGLPWLSHYKEVSSKTLAEFLGVGEPEIVYIKEQYRRQKCAIQEDVPTKEKPDIRTL